MKSKFKIFIYLKLGLFLVVITLTTNAQEEAIFNRLNGVSFGENIYLKWDRTKDAPEGTFLYRIDNEDRWHKLDDDMAFKIRNKHKNDFGVFFEFYNPLNYSVKSEVKDLDDPAYQAISDYISKLPTTATTAEAITSTPKSFVLNGTNNSVSINESMLLHEWIYEFSDAVDKTLIASTADISNSFKDLVGQINTIKDADDYLFNKLFLSIPEAGVEGFTVNGWIKARTDILYGVDNNYKNFQTELSIANKVQAKLVEKKTAAINALKSIEKLLSTDFDAKIAPFIPAANKDDFKKYSSSTAKWLSLNHNDRFDANATAIDKYKVFVDKLNIHIKKFTTEVCDSKGKNCNNYVDDYDFKLDWKYKKMKSFNYEITKLDKDGAEIAKSKSKGAFTVGKKLFFYPFVSTGIIYTNFSYPNYAVATENGVNKVAKTPDTKVNVRPTVFLNMLIANWDPVYPFMQLGITTGVNDVLLPIGVGFSFGSSFSISGGIILGYTKDLNLLNVGDIVKDDAALKTDLTNKGLIKGYFSLNYNIGKK